MRDQGRVEREREYHDARYDSDVRRRVAKYYAGTQGGPRRYRELVEAAAGQGRVLEYGCGTGSAAFDLARRGAQVTGIDISPVAIRDARAKARELGLTALEFEVMNAEQLDVPAASFDAICGSGILHHLDLDAALGEIARVLRPQGRAVFYEPLGHNPVINAYRRLTPTLRTADEHPLLVHDLEAARARFGDVRVEYFNLVTLATVPFRRLPGGARLGALAGRADAWLFRRVRPLRRFAWTVVIQLAEPRARG